MTNNNDLINLAQSIARTLSFQDDIQGPAKRTILELCHRLGARTVRVHKKADGYLAIDLYGHSRFLTFRESFLYRFFGVVPYRISDDQLVMESSPLPLE